MRCRKGMDLGSMSRNGMAFVASPSRRPDQAPRQCAFEQIDETAIKAPSPMRR